MTGGTYTTNLSVSEIGANTPLNGQTSRFNKADGIRVPLLYGTGPGRMSSMVKTTRTINALTAVTYDLYSATDFVDVFGDAVGFRNIKSITIWVLSGGDTAGVRIGGAASNCWTANFADSSDKALIYPDSGPWIADRNAGSILTTSALNLKIENLGAVAVTLAIRIAGGIDAAGYAAGPLGMVYP